MADGFFLRFRDNWKENYAAIVVWGYAYDIVIWPIAFWITTIGTSATGVQWPGPPLVPWEQLAVATANLGVIGAVQIFKKKQGSSSAEVSTETKTVVKSTDP